MLDTQASRTAMLAAIGRGQHRELHARPWVFDDPYALPLVGPQWTALWEQLGGAISKPVIDAMIAWTAVRSRYTEDRLEAGSFAQYVILGAGLDSFSWRRPDLVRSVRVVEIDHPATQGWKRTRIEELGLRRNGVVMAPVDFELETLSHGLHVAGLDVTKPTLFSWLGVSAYLTADAIEATLRTVADCGAGSEIVFDYALPPEHWDDVGSEFMTALGAIAAESGEPVGTLLAPPDAESVVKGCGLDVIDHPDHGALTDRYFADRRDGLSPLTCIRLIGARR